MVQVHVTPQSTLFISHDRDSRILPAGAAGPLAGQVWRGGFAKLPYTRGGRILDPLIRSDVIEVEGSSQ